MTTEPTEGELINLVADTFARSLHLTMGEEE